MLTLGNKVQIIPDPIEKSASYWCCFGGCRRVRGKASCPSRRDLANHSSGSGFWGRQIFLSLKTGAGAHRCSRFSQCVFRAAQAQVVIWVSSYVIVLWMCELVLECNTSVTESEKSFFKNLLILTLRLLEVDSVLCNLTALLPHSSLSQDRCLGLVVMCGFPSFELQFFQMLVVLQISYRLYSFPL